MYTDSLIPVAHAVHSSPKRYALLLGAGISVSAGLPTASDASGNMIRKIAAGKDDNWKNVIREGEKTEACLKWFEEQYSEKATFGRLMDKLGIYEGNRKDGLRKFIYQKDAEEIFDPVLPTDAHRSIARLVKSGMISLIITTNFDTLLEDALDEENVNYEVITEESDIKHMSVIPDRCRILKVNGDFERGTLRITPEDLKEYPEKIEDYLKRIFAEYGLVICGWSGIFDTHLSEILCDGGITRRYPAFWCLRDKSVVPSAVCRAISPARIEINDADCFFTTLEVVLERFSRFEPRTTLSAEAAVKKVKDALRDPRPDLSVPDVINSEADRVVHALKSVAFIPPQGYNKTVQFGDILQELERITTPLAAMCATLAYYEGGTYGNLIATTIDRLLSILNPMPGAMANEVLRLELKDSFVHNLVHLRFYPAVLVIYASGIAAVQNKEIGTLPFILLKPKFREVKPEGVFEKKPYFDYVNLWMTALSDISTIVEVAGDRFGRAGVFVYPTTILKEILRPLIPYGRDVDEAFDVFEFFYGLVYLDKLRPDPSQLNPNAPPFPIRSKVWFESEVSDGNKNMILPPHVIEYCSGIGLMIENCSFFHGNPEKFEALNRLYANIFDITAPPTGIQIPNNVRRT